MANTNQPSASTPFLQPGERVSGPLPALPASSPAVTVASPTPQGTGTPTRLQQRVGNLVSILGSLLTFVGFFLPTYLALPLLAASPPSNPYNPYLSPYYIPLEAASITGAQVLFLAASFGGFISNGGLTILALQWTTFLAIINSVGLASDWMLKFSRRAGIVIFGGILFLGCMGAYLFFYVAVAAIPVLVTLSISAKSSSRVRPWLKMAWPVIGGAALIGSTFQFFSAMSRVLTQIVGPGTYHYDYFSSLGSGAWLSFAGLLAALLGGVLAFQAGKQASASTP